MWFFSPERISPFTIRLAPTSLPSAGADVLSVRPLFVRSSSRSTALDAHAVHDLQLRADAEIGNEQVRHAIAERGQRRVARGHEEGRHTDRARRIRRRIQRFLVLDRLLRRDHRLRARDVAQPCFDIRVLSGEREIAQVVHARVGQVAHALRRGARVEIRVRPNAAAGGQQRFERAARRQILVRQILRAAVRHAKLDVAGIGRERRGRHPELRGGGGRRDRLERGLPGTAEGGECGHDSGDCRP